MTFLKYIGPDVAKTGYVTLPEGWPAATHEDTDTKRVKEKVESGNYEKVTAGEAKDEENIETVAPPPPPPVAQPGPTGKGKE